MEQEQAEQKAIPTISAEADILAARLAKLALNEVLTYEEMSKLVRESVQERGRGWLNTARNKVQRELSYVIVTVPKVGVRRAQGNDYLGIASTARERTRRAARKALKQSLLMPKDEFEQLDNQKKTQLNTDRTVLGTIDHFTRPKQQGLIQERVRVANNRLAIGEVLELGK